RLRPHRPLPMREQPARPTGGDAELAVVEGGHRGLREPHLRQGQEVEGSSRSRFRPLPHRRALPLDRLQVLSPLAPFWPLWIASSPPPTAPHCACTRSARGARWWCCRAARRRASTTFFPRSPACPDGWCSTISAAAAGPPSRRGRPSISTRTC